MATDKKIQFWKRNAKVPGSLQPVYGAQHPPLDPRMHKTMPKYSTRLSAATPALTPERLALASAETSAVSHLLFSHCKHAVKPSQNYSVRGSCSSELHTGRPAGTLPVTGVASARFLKEAPKTNALSIKSKKASSFLEFARSTSDAWDIGDDEEEEFLGGPPPNTPPNLNSKVAVATAAQVIHNYSKVREKPEWPQSTERVQANGSVVKSNSAVQLSQPSDGSSFRKPLHKQQSLPLRPVIPLIARISDQNASGAPPMAVREKTRLEKFRQLLASQNTDLEELRRCSWSGIPREFRPITWRLLSGYLPANMERREIVLKRKRDEYFGFIEQYYDSRNEEHHQDTYRQIHIDIPRTNPLIPLFQQAPVQEVFERILFIWAIRHPASGYVQGINDLVTPFFVVFLSEFVEEDVENFDVTILPQHVQRNIEADSFWCMSKLLDGIQASNLRGYRNLRNTGLPPLILRRPIEDVAGAGCCLLGRCYSDKDNYTFAQPGIQTKVKALEELVSRIDEHVHNHFQKYEVEYLQFAFRWMNNLLMRELPLRCTIRLWDTYQAEAEGFSHFHLYICAAFLIKWRKEILEAVDFQGLLLLLQNLPTIHWGNEEVGLLLAEAYRLKYMFADAPSHYRR
ncbi:TBC1 domain family member 22B isoform X2 [Acipenser ruthenus]|uniref:TBC1 domain family member 22B isoform X2 n=1 Tax=Acipenser ruthenus TaxID=7906 RepID=UPI002741C425|nr:TBC1 domain family member 22B isoform X2 [Acipenser ruthenus]